MRHDPTFSLWAVHCPSAEATTRLCAEADKLTRPEVEYVDTAESNPLGVPVAKRTPHRVGDLFSRVGILPPCPEHPDTFWLLFVRRPEADHYWKDVMILALKALRGTAPDTTTELVYRGEQAPAEIASLRNA